MDQDFEGKTEKVDQEKLEDKDKDKVTFYLKIYNFYLFTIQVNEDGDEEFSDVDD